MNKLKLCILILCSINLSCISLTRLDEVKTGPSVNKQQYVPSNFQIFQSRGLKSCVKFEDYHSIKKMIENNLQTEPGSQVDYIFYQYLNKPVALGFNYVATILTQTIIPLYVSINATTEIIVTNKKMETLIYRHTFDEQFLGGILMLPFISSRAASEVLDAKKNHSIQMALASTPEKGYSVPIDQKYKSEVCSNE